MVQFPLEFENPLNHEKEFQNWRNAGTQYGLFRLALQKTVNAPIRSRVMGIMYYEGAHDPLAQVYGSHVQGRDLDLVQLSTSTASGIEDNLKTLDPAKIQDFKFALIQYDKGVWEPKPADRLLAYVIALESLFLKKSDRAKRTALAERCSTFLAAKEPNNYASPEREKLRDLLEALYRERNRLVHGDPDFAEDGNSIILDAATDLDRVDLIVFDALWWKCQKAS